MAVPKSFLSLASEESSSLTRSFWLGKFLQQLQLPESQLNSYSRLPPVDNEEEEILPAVSGRPSSDDKRILDAIACLRIHETSLSPKVHELISGRMDHTEQCSSSQTATNVKLLLADATLDWDATEKILGEDRRDYTVGAGKCAIIAHHVHKQMAADRDLFVQLSNEEKFSWTRTPSIFIESIVDLMTSSSPLRVNSSLLLGTAALERALGDLYLTLSNAEQCPLLLRDLLATAELEKCFGPTAVYLLCCLIGPPSGLNLRNITWHGFASQTDIPYKLAVLFFVVAASLGSLLSPSQDFNHIQHRAYTTFPQEQLLAGVFEVCHIEDYSVLEKLFKSSYFILPSMLATWTAAVDAFKTERYGLCVALLLPSLEHGIRRVFACVNSCPERVLTAESTSLYTTFDEILVPVLPNGVPNKLKDEIGVAKLEMVLDILVHPEGLRIRDRISHGEVDIKSVSKTLANHVLCIATLFCVQYNLLCRDILARERLVSKWLDSESHYVSLFHPLSLLRKEVELKQLVSELDKWSDLPRPDSTPALEHTGHMRSETPTTTNSPSQRRQSLVKQLSTATMETLLSLTSLRPEGFSAAHQKTIQGSSLHVQCEGINELVDCVWSPLCTLNLARQQLELVGVLRKTVTNTEVAISQISATVSLRFKMLEERSLRSRQRSNYDHLLESLQVYQCSVILLAVLSSVTVSYTASLKDVDAIKKIIKYQKKVLQFSENFSSQTSPVRNRWEEADELCSSLLQTVLKMSF